jgi:hypothetical protein
VSISLPGSMNAYLLVILGRAALMLVVLVAIDCIAAWSLDAGRRARWP